MTNLDQQFSAILTQQRALEAHSVFSSIKNLDDLRVFMSWQKSSSMALLNLARSRLRYKRWAQTRLSGAL